MAARAHAERLGLLGILADGPQAQTEGRAHDAVHDQGGQRQQRQRVVVEGPGEEVDLVQPGQRLPQEHGPQDAHAFVAPGERVELVEERVEQHAERQREHAEVDLHVPHAEQPHRHGHHHRHQGRPDQDELEVPDAEAGREVGRGVRAQRDEQRVAEGQQPGGPEQQIEAEQRDAVRERRQQQRDLVARQHERRRQQRHGQQPGDHPRHHAVARAKRPAGRRTRTAMTTTYTASISTSG